MKKTFVFVLACVALAACIKTVSAAVPQLAATETLTVPVVFYGLKHDDARLWVCGFDSPDGGMSCVDWLTFDTNYHSR